MKLQKLWEYFISCEVEGESQHSTEHRGWAVISELSPETGLTEVFKALAERGDLKGLRRITNVSISHKEFFLMMP